MENPVSSNQRSVQFLLLVALLALLLPELFLTSIFLKLLFLGRGGQREAEAVHSHDDGDILNMVEMRNEAGLEGGKNLFDASCQELLALLVGVRNYEAVHVHLRHFLCFQFLLIILKNVQELNCVNREIHVDVVGAAKVHRQTALLIVELFHRLPGAHVPAEHPPLHLVCKAVFLQVLVTVRVQIVGNHEQVLLGCPNCERTHSTEQVDQHLPGAHQLEESVSFLLEAGAPVDLLKVDPELYPPLLQRGLVLLGSCHVLKGGSSVHVMEFFRLVDHSFDVRALEESDLSDDSAPPFLTFCKVVVGDVPNRLEAPGKVNKLVITLVIAFREPVQDLLAVIIFKGKLLFYLPYSDVLKLFGKCLSIGLTVEEDDLFFFGELHNSGKTEQMQRNLGRLMVNPLCRRILFIWLISDSGTITPLKSTFSLRFYITSLTSWLLSSIIKEKYDQRSHCLTKAPSIDIGNAIQ